MVNSKHIATFILGAAAGFAAAKYMSMTDEEKEKFLQGLKDKASDLKGEAESVVNKAREYFEELKTKGTDSFKEHFSEAESVINDLFNNKKPGSTTAT